MVPRVRWRFAALAACCVALAGCGGGGGSDEDQVREVVHVVGLDAPPGVGATTQRAEA